MKSIQKEIGKQDKNKQKNMHKQKRIQNDRFNHNKYILTLGKNGLNTSIKRQRLSH